MPFNTSLDTCAGWRQVESAVVLGRQVTVVELTATVNTNSSHCGILTQIQIQGTAVLEACVCVTPEIVICATPACILSLHYC
jgi:hypothetical protein